MNIVVIGGGLSGWLTSLYALYAFPQAHIGVIESSEIGILGAGEGSTPSLISMLEYLDIDVADMIVKTNATIKNGIRYIGWSEENPDYFHGFDPEWISFDISQRGFRSHPYQDPLTYSLYLENLYRDDHIDQFNFMSKLSRYDKVPIKEDMSKIAPYGLHFDATSIAEYLKEIAIQRGVKHFDAKVTGFDLNEDGYISCINLEDGIVLSDFVFDCSGLHRVIIKEFDASWHSFRDDIPMKMAIPFSIQSNIFPHTGAVAMNAGWMWQIPLQNRIGSGYVFDTDFISEEDARKELLEKYNIEVDSKPFNIDAGAYKNIWVKNVVAIGLSAGFLEPLEANSIWLFTRNLERFFRDKNNLFTTDQKIKDLYNDSAFKDMQETVDFIRLHYMTDKRNTGFWRGVSKYNVSEELKDILEISQSRPPYETDLLRNSRMYWDSYYQIMFGNNIVDRQNYKEYYEKTLLDGEITYAYNSVLGRQEVALKECITLQDYLERIKNA